MVQGITYRNKSTGKYIPTNKVSNKNNPQEPQTGEKLEVLVDRTQNLAQSAQQFHKRAKKVKCAMRWQNIKLYLIFGMIALIIGLILYFSFKGDDSGKSGSPTTPTPAP